MSRLRFVPAVVLFFVCSGFGQSRAVLRCNGAVKVNGVSASKSTVVMEGDRIDVDNRSSASLILPGKMIPLGSSSSVVYHDGALVPSSFAPTAKDKDQGKDQVDDKNKNKGNGNGQGQGNGNGHKKCISPKKPGKDKDCDDDDDHGHGDGDDHGHGDNDHH